jgi:hypothetical protein
MPEVGQLHPFHPLPQRGSLIPRLGHGQQRLLPILREAGVTTTVSPLHFMGHNRELALFATATPPTGLALDPMTYLRQLPATKRGTAYRLQTFGGAAAFDPDRDAIDLHGLLRLAEDPIDAQRGHGATLLMTSYHLCGAAGTRGRSLDLALAAAGIDHFQSERIDQPAEHAAIQVPRELFATVAIERGVVSSPNAVDGLASAYGALEVDGYWVKIEGFSEHGTARELHGGAALLGALSETGRSVVCSGAGALHLALLVSDIASSIGLGEAERFSMPDAAAPPPKGPRHRLAYHPAFIHSFQCAASPARRAFAAAPCRCGLHPENLPPAGHAVDEHCALVRTREAREAAAGSQEERREWLHATVALASHLGEDASIDVPSRATFETVIDGIGHARGDLAQAS